MKLPKPEDRVYETFEEWFQREAPFVGDGKDLLRDRDDLVALSPAVDNDALSISLRNLVGPYLSVSGVAYASSLIRGRLLWRD